MGVRRFWQNVRRTSPFGGQVLVTAGTNILLAMAGIATGVLAARLLGPKGRGELAAIQLSATYIATVAMLGLPDALVYFSARETEGAGRHLGSGMVLALLSSLPFVAVGYLVMPFLLSSQSVEVIMGARWYLLFVPLFALVFLPQSLLRGLGEFVVWNGLRITPSMGWLSVLMLAWFLGRAEPGFVAVGFLVVIAVLCLPVMIIVTRRVTGPFCPDVRNWGGMLRYGLPCMTTSVPQILNARLDQMMLAVFLPAHALGQFVVAAGWGSGTSPLLNAIGAVVFPHVASRQGHEERAKAFARGTRLGVLVALVLAVVVVVPTGWAVPFLFGEKFAAAVPVARVMVVVSTIQGLNLLIEEGLRGLGYPASAMWAELCGLVVTASLLAFLLIPMGIMGAALASLFGYTVVTACLVFQAKGITGQSPVSFLCPTGCEVALGWSRIQALFGGMPAK